MKKRKQCGATVVEAALTLVLLMMFLDGILEFGRAYNIYQVVSNAAREGARYAVAPVRGTATLPAASDVQALAKSFTDSGGVKATTTVVNCPSAPAVLSRSSSGCTLACGPATPINGVTLSYTGVLVDAPYTFAAPALLFGSGSPGTIDICGMSSMRNEIN